MFKEYIKIKLLLGSVIEFEMTNGIVAISQAIINVPDRLKDFGRQLEEYPLQPDTVTINFKASMLYRGDTRLQGGLQYFDRFVIDVYPYKTNGEAAITVKVQNNKPELLGNNVEFSMFTNAISVVELGAKLKTWNPEIDKESLWEAE